MKTKKNIINNRGVEFSISKYPFSGKLTRKTISIFWYCIDILSCKIKRIAKLYEKTISKEYEKEFKIFDISNDDQILHIGCGAYPITVLTIAKFNNGKIIGIDRNPKLVKLAVKIIRKNGLEKKVKIENGNGSNYFLDKFDTIIVSGCSIPKGKVLKHVFETAKPHSKIIVRESTLTANSIVESIKLHKDINLVKSIRNNPFPLIGWKSFYLIKK